MNPTYLHNILCVDDNENNLYTLGQLLGELERCKITKANLGKAALEVLLNEHVDLILLDIQMPEMDGFEVATLVKSNKRTMDIPIIFLTAVFKSEDFIRKGFTTGAVDYLTKPIDDNQLLNKINLYLKLFDREKALEELNMTLNERVKLEVNENRKKDYIIIQQSRLASMGDFIMHISHHWRQPLNSLGLLMQDVLDAFNYGELTKEYIESNVDQCMKILSYMSGTIDEMRTFFKNEAEPVPFSLNSIIESTIILIEPLIKYLNIKLDMTLTQTPI